MEQTKSKVLLLESPIKVPQSSNFPAGDTVNAYWHEFNKLKIFSAPKLFQKAVGNQIGSINATCIVDLLIWLLLQEEEIVRKRVTLHDQRWFCAQKKKCGMIDFETPIRNMLISNFYRLP